MIPLSKAALRYAFDICEEQERYRVGIVVAGVEQYEEIAKSLHCWAKQSGEVFRANKAIRDYVVEFKNGSYLRLYKARESERGFHANLLVVGPGVEWELVKTAIAPSERVSWFNFKYREDEQ